MRTSSVAVGLLAGSAALAAARIAWWRRQDEPLEGRVALVAGGSRGLGLAIAERLVDEGCRVAVLARDAAELARARVALERRGTAIALPCDVGDGARVDAAVDEVERRLGPVDVLVNVAGEIEVGAVETMREADIRRSLDIMLWGVVHTTEAVLPGMRERRWGRIVNVTSVGGKVAVPHLLTYATAKFAAVGYSEGLAAEVRRHGVRVTTVVPGLMRTGSHLRAHFRGRAAAEYRLFAPLASAPLLALDAERAAGAIVAAARRGRPELVIGLPANVLMRVNGLAPGLTTDVMSVVARLLPHAGDDAPTEGRHVRDASRLPRAATALGDRAAERWNQLDEDG